MLKKSGYVALSLLALLGVAVAGGAFQGYPLVGGLGTTCLSTGNGGVCNQFWPAGPSVVTGNETIPADTNVQGAGSSGNPSTVAIPLAAIGVGPYSYEAPLTGVSFTVPATTRNLIIEPAGTIATHTVVLPAATALVDNQTFGLCSTQIITALTITPGTGTTVSNTMTATIVPAATGAAACGEWIYRQANTNWYRIH